MVKKGKLLKNINPPIFICIGVLFSYLVLTAVSFILALFCNMTEDPARIVGIMAFIALLITAAVSSFTLSRLRGEGGSILAILTAAGFIIVRIVVSLFLSGTGLSDLLDCVCYLGVGAIFALLGGRRVGRRRR